MSELQPLPREMALGDLLDAVSLVVRDDNVAWRELGVTGLSLDSRDITPGDVYLALPGRTTHGMSHASAAAEAGAVAVLTVVGASSTAGDPGVPVLEVPELWTHVSALADVYFGSPAENMLLVAVTGTDGKTSVCRFVADAFASIGKAAGYIGTIGWGLVGGQNSLDNTALTTPDVITLRRMLRALVDAGADVVAMEASSHGIAEGRLEGLPIDIAVLTNIGRDHLDYHGSEEAYRNAKARLFDWPGLSGIVVNADDTLGQTLVGTHSQSTTCRLATFSMADTPSDASSSDADVRVRAVDTRTTAAGIQFTLDDTGARADIDSRLLGRFNVANLLACYGVLRLSGVTAETSALALNALSPVPGRMDRVDSGSAGEPVVIIDYAHTPDALNAALAAARAHCEGDLIVVFGCGGDRDPGKRAPMGQAARAADVVLVTDDNPRTEESSAIIDAVMKGLAGATGVTVVPDRRAAIERAVSAAQDKDVVLIAGKGHEDYQIVGETRRAFSDHGVARNALHARANARLKKTPHEVRS